MKRGKRANNIRACSVLKKHFAGLPLHELVGASRTFPVTTRVDLQAALETLFTKRFAGATQLGLHSSYEHDTIGLSHLTVDGNYPVLIGPLQFDEIDAGEVQPARCLKKALWLAKDKDVRFGLLMTPAMRYGRSEGVHLELVVPPGDAGLEFSRRLLDQIEKTVNEAGSYRGKVLSLEASDNYYGRAGSVKVHRLRPVARDQIILPEKTLALLERNVMRFIEQRDKLLSLKMPVKKGLLLYGPPGTGKTHTIHYLASQLKNHTTLLITAEQVGLLDEYMQLARFLQPAMVVIEDVDLIARARESMRNACEESLLNRLLNEMDGLREEASILFILTTNRPDQLESALASRPGRIDQAIEFPLPDEEGRRKLIRLYGRGLTLPDDLIGVVARKTNRASAAFIKELMRRSAQFHIENDAKGDLTLQHIESALDEMLFSGGSLNAKLLGAAASSD